MSEAEVALAFSADVWVEELHRHLSDHGGARVRSVVVDASGAREESYDVLVAGHRWAPLTRALVEDVHARGRSVLGVYDREERASRRHLSALGVDALVESDGGPDAFVRAITRVAQEREQRGDATSAVAPSARRQGRLVTVGGAPGSGRTEIAAALAYELSCGRSTVLLDADDVAPAVAVRLGLAIEPNLRTAIDAAEHGLGEFDSCVQRERRSGLCALAGLPNAAAWAQVRPGEVVRVAERLAATYDVVVADGAGHLEDVGAHTTRSRFATARALVSEADVLVTVSDASPAGVVRQLTWIVDAHALAPDVPVVVVLNRAPPTSFRRRELEREITTSAPVHGVVCVQADPAVADACWDGRLANRGRFAREVRALSAAVEELL